MQRLPVAERRAALVTAALEVGEREGAAAITVRRVADQAGVAPGIVHYCFADKAELLVEVATAIVAELAAAAATAVELDVPGRRGAPDPGFGALLDRGVLGLWRLIERTAPRQLLTYELTTVAVRDPDLTAASLSQYRVTEHAVLGFLDFATERAQVRWASPQARVDTAGLVLAVIDGVTLRWLVDRDSSAARRRLRLLAARLATEPVSSSRDGRTS